MTKPLEIETLLQQHEIAKEMIAKECLEILEPLSLADQESILTIVAAFAVRAPHSPPTEKILTHLVQENGFDFDGFIQKWDDDRYIFDKSYAVMWHMHDKVHARKPVIQSQFGLLVRNMSNVVFAKLHGFDRSSF